MQIISVAKILGQGIIQTHNDWRLALMIWSRFFVAIFLLMTSCAWKGQRVPSILVIAVEGLSFDSISCESDLTIVHEFEGYRKFCEESVRFSHAFTTSTLSQPAITSLLTGRYPFETGVRTNGNNFLPGSIETVAEVAIRRGFRTAFISGGAPILRKSGLSQGFEIFDEGFNLLRAFRSAKDSFTVFANWLDREVGNKSFFTVIFLADLEFPDSATTSELGEVRDRSLDGQMRSVGESLSFLIDQLKARGRWSDTTVILTGLNGPNDSHRPEEIPPLDLYAESTQVALFIKPAQKSRDLGIEWAIDKNVSLVDVGETIYDLLGKGDMNGSGRPLPVVSLKQVLERPEVDWDEDRLILIESAWGEWRGLSNIRYAARKRQYLYIHDVVPKVYNTLIDRMELAPLPRQDPLWVTLRSGMLDFFVERGMPGWAWKSPSESSQNLNRLNQAQRLWRRGQSGEAAFIQAALRETVDSRSWRWALNLAIGRKDWNSLLKLGEKYSVEPAVYLARRQLGEKVRLPKFPCRELFLSVVSRSNKPHLMAPDKLCHDDLLMRLHAWATEKQEDRRLRAQETFFSMYAANRADERLGEMNYAHFLTWDVEPELPRGYGLSEVFIALPENASLANIIRSRRLREDQNLDL